MRFARSMALWSFAMVGSVAVATTANAVSTAYAISAANSSASVTVELQGVGAIGSGAIDITGSLIEFDDAAPSLDSLNISGSSVNTITLSQAVDVGLGAIDSVFVNSATMVDAGAFTTTALIPGVLFNSDGPVFVTSALTTNLGAQPFAFSDTLSASPIIITDNGTDVSFELFGFTLASFDVIDSQGNTITDGLTVKMDLGIVAAPVPEPSAALLFMVGTVVVLPFIRRTARRT